jgi:hypothetical protein
MIEKKTVSNFGAQNMSGTSQYNSTQANDPEA